MTIESKITAAIAATLGAGQGQAPFRCLETKSPKKEVKKLRKRLNASENWRVYDDTVWNSAGIPFNGIASWGQNVTVVLNGYEYRLRVLQIDRLGKRISYAIPISVSDSFSSLPCTELSAGEVVLIKEMANELSTKGPVSENVRSVKHPAKSTLIGNRDKWENKGFDALELLRMIKEDRALFCIIVAALAAQYRSFLSGADLPEGIYNFVISSKGKDCDLWFYAVLQALTFNNAPGKNVEGPITITMKEANDLKRWKLCHERLAVIHTATGALLWPLLEEIEKSDQFLRSGGPSVNPLPTVPISLTNRYLHHPQAIDVLLPVKSTPVPGGQLDLLRTAMSRMLRRKIAESAFQLWKNRRTQPTAYRRNGFMDWQEVLLETCLQTWFPSAEYQSAQKEILADTQRQLEEQDRAVSETLQRGVELLTNPSKYKTVERPSSRAEWDEAVQDGASAFWYTPQRGDDKGTTFLTFTSETLKRLLSRAGCTEEFYDAFLRRCAGQALLNSKDRTVKLGKDEIAAITFCIQKP